MITELIAFLAAEGRTEDIVKIGNDESFLDQLLAEYRSKMAAVE